jgi:ABC-type multidrug transport system permease subunit
VLQSHSTAQLKEAGFFEKDAIGVGEEFTPRFPKDVQLPPVVPFHGIQHAGWMTQCRLLFSRELCQLIRNRGAFMIRIGTTIFFGLLYGLIYFDIGKEDLSNQINVSSTFGAIAVFLVTTISGVAQSSLMDFPRDRRTFLREYSTNHYSALPYFFAHLCFEVILTVFQTFLQVLVSYFLMDLRMNFFLFWSINFVLALGVTSFGVLLGSIVENPNVAIQLMPALVVPQMLFSGFFISTDLIPSFLRWIQYLCALTYAMWLALFYEFQECDYETCVETLERNGVLELDTIWYWTILLAITVCFRTVSMIALRQKADFG